MRVHPRRLLVWTAVLGSSAALLTAAQADAYRVEMYVPPSMSPIEIGGLVTIPVYLDTEGGADITLLGVGVLFDESVFRYRQDLSSSTSYLLYTNAKAPYLVPDPSCVGACGIYPLRSNQVQIGFISDRLPLGVPGSGRGLLANLVFQALYPGFGSFDFDFDPSFGSILQLGDLSRPPLWLHVYTPEPGTVVLLGLGLASLGWAHRRSLDRAA